MQTAISLSIALNVFINAELISIIIDIYELLVAIFEQASAAVHFISMYRRQHTPIECTIILANNNRMPPSIANKVRN